MISIICVFILGQPVCRRFHQMKIEYSQITMSTAEALFQRMPHTQAWESMVIAIYRNPFTPTLDRQGGKKCIGNEVALDAAGSAEHGRRGSQTLPAELAAALQPRSIQT